jgi:hypothetical protein
MIIIIIIFLFNKNKKILQKENWQNAIDFKINNNLELNLDYNLSSKKYNIAIMTIFKNEQDYLEEWLDYHILQGIEQIYMYCNDSNINNYPFLSNIKYQQYITLIDWTNKKNEGRKTVQKQAYTHCVVNYADSCQFLLMLDIDEFLVPIKNFKSVSQYIYSIKSQWDSIMGFKIQRYNFGSNGHINKPKGSVMSNYLLHEKICSSYKTMANTNYINKDAFFYGVHDFNFIKNGKLFNKYFGYHETKYPNRCNVDSINEIPLVINHYYTKSYEEYILRCEMWRGGGINPINYRNNCTKNFISNDVNHVLGYD